MPLLFLLPSVGLISFLTLYPLGRLIATSFQNLGAFQLVQHKVVWDGLANYRTIFASGGGLGTSILQTALFVLACVALTMAIGTGVALLLGRIGKVLRTVVTVCMLFAWAMPTSAAAIVWTWLFQQEYGVVNSMLTSLGLNFSNHNWFGSEIWRLQHHRGQHRLGSSALRIPHDVLGSHARTSRPVRGGGG